MAFYKKRKGSFKRRTWRRKTRGKYARKTNLKSLISKVLMRKSETKSLVAATENVALYHNYGASFTGVTAVIFNPWQSIYPGTGANGRIGTEIYPRGMAVRMELFNKLDRPNLHYRIIVAVIPKIINGAATTAAFDFRDTTGTGNVITAWMKPDSGIKVLYDKTIRNEAGFSAIAVGTAGDQDGKEAHKFVKFYIKSKRGQKLMWDTYGNLINKPMIMYVLPYDSFGTLVSDNVATCAINTKYYWKDV